MTATILSFPGRPLASTPDSPLQNGSVAHAHVDPPRAPTHMVDGKRVPLTVKPLERRPRLLTQAESTLQDRMLSGFFEGARPARNHEVKSIKRDWKAVLEFLAYVGQPIWLCAPSDFESWGSHLALERKLAGSTQRVMQGAVATFFDYLVDSEDWQNAALQISGRIRQVATRDSRVVHTCDTPVRERSYLTAAELTQFFAVLDSMIEAAALDSPRQLKALQRDRAMFYTSYAYGLRLSEGYKLNVSSFFSNADLPEMGRFGYVGVFGKGANGSGPRFRHVACIHPDVPAALEWYLAEVRSQFKCKQAHADAMWLSERGERLSRSSIWARFKHVMALCGLDARLFTTHGLRHMSISHQAEANIPLPFISANAGHQHMATTTIYTHLSNTFVRDVARNHVRGLADFDPEAP